MIRDGQEMPNLFTFTLTVILHLPLFVLFLSTASQRTSKTQGFHGAMGTVVNKMLHLNCGAKERKPLLGMTRPRTRWLAPLILVYGLLVSLVKETGIPNQVVFFVFRLKGRRPILSLPWLWSQVSVTYTLNTSDKTTAITWAGVLHMCITSISLEKQVALEIWNCQIHLDLRIL